MYCDIALAARARSGSRAGDKTHQNTAKSGYQA